MQKHKVEKRLQQLRTELRNHDYLYYVLNKPRISDEQYDVLMKELRDLEETFPNLITPDSPTQRIGVAPLKELDTIRHAKSMLSLDSALEIDEIYNFDDRVKRELGAEQVEYVAEPKLDGLSVELVYENGKLIRGSTRGDGITGEDVTENIKTIHAVPLILRSNELQLPKILAVRGEVIMNIADFEDFNKQLIQNNEQPMANPRNAAAGSLRRLDSSETAQRPLNIFFYEMINAQGVEIETQWNALQYLKKWGLKINPYVQKCSEIDAAIKYHHNMAEKRDSLAYEIDGVVVKVNDVQSQEKLAVKARSPRWAIAYKFPSRKEKTKVMDIMAQVGRTGTLTPVALLKPVDISGVTVSRATLHNQDFIDEMDVHIGDIVRVGRAGDVIPEVTEVIKSERTGKEKKYHLPSSCPMCGSKVVKEGAFYRCTGGLACIAQLKRNIAHFASKGAMDIEHLGRKNVGLLVDQGLLKGVSDVYKLKKDDLLTLPRFAEKSAENLIDAIEKSKEQNLARFVYGLGIPTVGEHIAQVLVGEFKSLARLMTSTEEEMLGIYEIGPETASNIVSFFMEKRNKLQMDKMRKLGVKATVAVLKEEKSRVLDGKSFVFTGSLNEFSRSNAKQIVEKFGGRIMSSVSNSTDYVVKGEKPGSKYKKAKKLGITIINEDDFKKLIGV